MIPATGGDIDLLLELMSEYYACDGLRFDPGRAMRALEQLLGDAKLGHAWLIGDEGATVGYLFLTFGFSLEFGGRFALVDELYLRPENRGRGLGAAALAFAEKTALRMGFEAIRLEVEHENLRAQDLYGRIGFNAHERYLMTKWIAGGAPGSTTAGEGKGDGTEETESR